MKTIRISAELWELIKREGKYGEETPDEVLWRLLGLLPRLGRDARVAERPERITARVVGNELRVGIGDGTPEGWPLPAKEARQEIARIRDEALAMLRNAGATVRQQGAVRRALSRAGYRAE